MVLVDGECLLCDGFARFVASRDVDGVFLFETQQSNAGQQLLKFFDQSLDLKTIILVESRGKTEELFTKSSAVLKILSQLPAPWSYLRVFLYVPCMIRDWVYVKVAENRYHLFGRKEVCSLPDEVVRARLLKRLTD